jgi:hypothetical protein
MTTAGPQGSRGADGLGGDGPVVFRGAHHTIHQVGLDKKLEAQRVK